MDLFVIIKVNDKCSAYWLACVVFNNVNTSTDACFGKLGE